MKLPNHKSLSIEHNCHKSEGETLSYWLQQLQPEPTDFPSEEARQQALAADELWAMQWQDSDGANFLLAPTLGELIQFARKRLYNKMVDFN